MCWGTLNPFFGLGRELKPKALNRLSSTILNCSESLMEDALRPWPGLFTYRVLIYNGKVATRNTRLTQLINMLHYAKMNLSGENQKGLVIKDV